MDVLNEEENACSEMKLKDNKVEQQKLNKVIENMN